jgi:hypothetical protein
VRVKPGVAIGVASGPSNFVTPGVIQSRLRIPARSAVRIVGRLCTRIIRFYRNLVSIVVVI